VLETKAYFKKLKKFLKKHPDVFSKYEKVVTILEINPQHSSLRLHKLQGNFHEYYSVSLDMEYRIIIDFIIIEKEIFLIDIGSHNEVY